MGSAVLPIHPPLFFAVETSLWKDSLARESHIEMQKAKCKKKRCKAQRSSSKCCGLRKQARLLFFRLLRFSCFYGACCI